MQKIPVYDLYGETHAGSLAGFVHVERLHVRAHVHAWTILAHRHSALAQLFVLTVGGGRVGIDGTTSRMDAPAMIWLPPGVVHDFHFDPDTDGTVVTAAVDCLAHFRALVPELAPRLENALVLAAPTSDLCKRMSAHLAAMIAELPPATPGARGAVLSHFALALIALARSATTEVDSPRAAETQTLAGFRALIEQNFRARWSMPDYAAALGISTDRLHRACITITGQPPSDLLHQRLMVEARRLLIYTDMGIAAIAYSLGFDDAAYFSRFFARRAGQSPKAFRASAIGNATG